MAKHTISAGLLMVKVELATVMFFLVHPGGPFYKKKNSGVWTIPKGVPDNENEDLLSVAMREFQEETGIAPKGPFISIGYIQQKAGKIVHAWAFQGTWDRSEPIQSNTFSMEWPPKSGKFQNFPEVDEAQWMSYEDAMDKINPAQIPFLERAKLLLR